MTQFNKKYDHYISSLPRHILLTIKNTITEKYALDDANDFIDELFERRRQAYQRKREYDRAYYTRMHQKESDMQQGYITQIEKLNQDLEKVKQENAKIRETCTRIYTQWEECPVICITITNR